MISGEHLLKFLPHFDVNYTHVPKVFEASYMQVCRLLLTRFVLSGSTTRLSFNVTRCHVSRILLSFANVPLVRATTSSCSLPNDFL